MVTKVSTIIYRMPMQSVRYIFIDKAVKIGIVYQCIANYIIIIATP